jgi:single-strand DNA-binding protein
MSRSLNKATIIGNVGADPKTRTAGSVKVAEFSVATGRRIKGKDGEWTEKPEWHRIIAWGNTADAIEQYVKKGDRVYVEGEIQYRQYDDKDGVTRYVTEINARDVMFLGGKRAEATATVAATTPAAPSYDEYDDDLPF